jgi:hypothetical protein
VSWLEYPVRRTHPDAVVPEPLSPYRREDAMAQTTEFACPRCGNDLLDAASDGWQTNFLCRSCWVCWHVELGYMAPVPVITCPGCPHQDECRGHEDLRAALLADHARGDGS